MNDQLSKDFNHIQPMTVSDFFFLFGFLKRAKEDSDYDRLYKRIIRKEKISVFTLKLAYGRLGRSLSKAGSAFIYGNSSLTVPMVYWQSYARAMGCQYDAAMTNAAHESKDTFFNDLIKISKIKILQQAPPWRWACMRRSSWKLCCSASRRMTS